MTFFSNFFGEKTGIKVVKEKPAKTKISEEESIAQEISHVLHTVAMPVLTISQLADFFEIFQSILSRVESVDTQYNCVRKMLDFCGKLITSRANIQLIQRENFHSSFEIKGFLEGLLVEPLPLRARHVLALHRFCTALKFQLEVLRMKTSCSSFEGVRNPNASVGALGHLPLPTSQGITIDPCLGLNLKRIYLKLLEGNPFYLPTVEEYHEIITRTSELLRKEHNVLEVHLPAVVVGDIHGQINDLLMHVFSIGGPLVSDSVLNSYCPDSGCSFSASSAHPQQFNRTLHGTHSSSSFTREGHSPPSSPTHPRSFRSSTAHKHGEGFERHPPFLSSSSHTKLLQKSVVSREEAKSSVHGGPMSFLPKREEEPVTYLFLGDYVDRGKNSLQCLCLLYVAKLLSPRTIFLLRGNHECGFTNRHYGFLSECHTMYPIRNGKATSRSFSANNSLTSMKNGLVSLGHDNGDDGDKLNDNTTMPLPTIFSLGEEEDDNELQKIEGSHGNRKANGSYLSSPACSGPGGGFPLQREVNQGGSGDHPELPNFNNFFSELPEHPLWTAANESFKCLPLAAALIREVPEEEVRGAKEETHKDGGTPSIPSILLPVEPNPKLSGSTIHTARESRLTPSPAAKTENSASVNHQSPSPCPVPTPQETSAGIAGTGVQGVLLDTCGTEPDHHSKKKMGLFWKKSTPSPTSHRGESAGSREHHRVTSFASSWSGHPTEEKTKKIHGEKRGCSRSMTRRPTSSVTAMPSSGSKSASCGTAEKQNHTLPPTPPLTTTNTITATTAKTAAAATTVAMRAPSTPVAPSTLPSAVPPTFETAIIAMHGGISPYIKDSIDGILAINRFDDISSGALADITWSDPLHSHADESKKSFSSEELHNMAMSSLVTFPGGENSNSAEPEAQKLTSEAFMKPAEYAGPSIGFVWSARGTGHNFGEDATCKFINTNKLFFIVRAHQCVQEGFRWCHSNRVLTVFSAANYCGLGNKGAVLLVDKYGTPTTKNYDMEENSTNSWPTACPPSYFL